MLVTYDPEVDILMIYLQDPEASPEYARELSDQVVAHYGAGDKLLSIEVLDASSSHPKEELLRYSVDRLMSLSKAAQVASLSHSTLRQLVFKRRLKSLKYGDIWMTTQEWLDEYLASRRRPKEPVLN